MSARSLNQVELIGNLTRDPELRYTPNNTPVCTFSVATNRQWTTESGEKKEDVEFHRLVAWQKLAEICGKYLSKGRRVWVRGRLQTRSWTAQDGANRQVTEIVLEDMIMLDSRPAQDGADTGGYARAQQAAQQTQQAQQVQQKNPKQDDAIQTKTKSDQKSEPVAEKEIKEEEVSPEDIPF